MKNLLIFALSIFLSQLAFSQTTPTFQNILSKLNNEGTNERATIFEAYLASIGQTPIIEDNKVIWVTKGGINQTPYILADFNGFLNRRYVQDKSVGQMQNIAGTNWYYFEKDLASNAVVNYLFETNGKTFTDPLNPELQISFGSLNSVLKMPNFQLNNETLLNTFYPKGELIKDSIFSEIFEHTRKFYIYLPTGYGESKSHLPLAFFHDGSFNIEEGFIPRILDNLITEQKIEPTIAIFDYPGIRGKEYRGDESYRSYLKDELFPYLIEKYRIKEGPENKAVFGWSRGGMSALYVSHSLNIFGKLGAISPAIFPEDFNTFIQKIEGFGNSPEKIIVAGSIYDHLWYNDAQLLKEYFQKQNKEFKYLEIPAGHNIPAWRTLMDDMLIEFFPY